MDYQFKSIGKTCAGTGQALQPGSRCHSVLVERDGQMYRLDFSEAGWKGPPEDAIGEWISVVDDETPKPKTIDAESLMRYFEQLYEDANPAHDEIRYVLAVMLLQKRRLRLDGSRTDEDGEEFLQFVGSKGEGPYEIPDQQLTEEEILALQNSLNEQLMDELSEND